MFGQKARRIEELEEALFHAEIKNDKLSIANYLLKRYVEKLEKETEILSDKHWNECWQIGEYDNDLRKLREENRKLKERIEQLEASIEKTSE